MKMIATMDFEAARHTMIEQQIRTWEVLDQHTLDLIAAIHREDFIPAQHRNIAFVDTQIPLGHGQYTFSPKMEARIIQSLALKPTDTVLEIGTGCAYLTALLASACAYVYSVDIFPDFSQSALSKLKRLGIDNAEMLVGDGINGWAQQAPYDVIVVTGSMAELDDNLIRQLNPGGRLFSIIGVSPLMQARLSMREGENAVKKEILFETDVLPLIGAPSADKFAF